jgi:hypothetical protein
MKFLYAVFGLWLAIALVPDPAPPKPAGMIEEKVWLSQTCKGSRWYLEDSDEQTATLSCYQSADPDGDR